ncbi:LRR receptor-like serine/threonine-protein kinase RPK2 [Silene latifolia]|uniref:LRR receptor-like serine/threonine-protein kinase RPK2 n=1 Tax=Silene latifolia TaxID=37657 RepID=UPI003D77FF43
MHNNNLHFIRNPNSVMMFLVVVIFVGLFGFQVNCKPISEKQVLLEFKSSISDPSGVLSTWVSVNDSIFEHCSWYGIVCDDKSSVSELNIVGGPGQGNVVSNNSKFIQKVACFKVANLPLYGFGIRRSCHVINGKLIGALPNVVAKLRNIRVLSLPFHHFTGFIPNEIWDLDYLEVLDLEGNFFSGLLPVEVNVNGLRRLRVLNLGLNRIGGEIPSWLSRAVDMEMINLSGNQLEGLVPDFFGGFPRLWGLYLSLNRFKGEIPDTWERNCRNLRFLDLSGNALNGRIPVSLGNCQELRALLLYSNTLQGSIPCEIGLLRNLHVLDVSRNRLGGYIPSELGNCRHLSVLVLSNLCDPYMVIGKSLVESAHGEGNLFQGPIPVKLKTLPKLTIVWAPETGLNDEIPLSWRTCESLKILKQSQNYYLEKGNEVSKGCKSRTQFDLTLTKQTRKFLSKQTREFLKNRRVRGVSRFAFCTCESLDSCISESSQSNKASAAYRLFFIARSCQSTSSLPSKARLLSEFNPTSNEMASSSNGQDSADKLPAAESPSGSEANYGNKFNSIEIASIVSASVIVLVLLALVVLFIYTRKCAPRDGSRVQVYERKEIRVFTDIGVSLTFQNVVRATDCFSSGNCIGCGGFGATYKAEISPSVIVAVKRLAVGRFHCIQQFHAEIKTLGRIRHPNLVTLIGYHASETEMFLIYNYLPGGNLEKFIQERSTKSIKWKGIHKIALDVAHAIAYLHDECNPRVIHRDVKPSNILLDNEYNAYLSDFGLSRLLENSETHATTGVAGTFGYLAPEYAMTCRVSEKADVYSYGVVLLELISDKKALDPSFSSHGNGFNIVTWAHMLLRQGRAKEVFTAGIWESGPHDDLVDVLHLAVKCTVDSLTIRPTMKQVIQLLKQFRPL